jgi:predicted phage tail protein
MATLKLYGWLRKFCGFATFQIEVKSPLEALKFLIVNFPGLEQQIGQPDKYFKIWTQSPGITPLQLDEIGHPVGVDTVINFAPVISGRGDGFWSILGGLALIGLVVATGGAAGFLGATGASILGGLGASLVLGGISQLLTPMPKPQTIDDAKIESYSFSGIVNVSRQGVPVPIVYGETIVGSVAISVGLKTEDLSDPPAGDGSFKLGLLRLNSLRSTLYVVGIDLLCEGVIQGLKTSEGGTADDNAYKSIYFDKTPIRAADGTYNFSEPEMYWHWGNFLQLALPSYLGGGTETLNNVGVEIKKNLPAVRTITDNNVNAVRVIIGIPALLQVVESNEPIGALVQIAIDIQYSGGSYQEIINDTISGKTTSLYQKGYEIGLSGSFPVNVRVRRITDDSTSNKLQDATQWLNYTEIIYTKFQYPHSALIGFKVDARQFSQIPNRSYLIRGTKVVIPNNATVDTVTGRLIYNGVWNGGFQAAQWTSDPAWCLWDLLTSKRYGLGEFLPATQLDKWSFYQVSQYCSALVPDGFGGQEPRFSLNININSGESAYNLIGELLSAFRALSYWQSGTLAISQDSPKDPTYLLNTSNVVNGNFTYSGSSLKSRATVAIVEWLNLVTQEPDYEYVEDYDAIARYGVITRQIKAVGTTSRGQANRFGRWMLLTEQTETETVSFQVSVEAGIILRPGMVVAIADPVRSAVRVGGKIASATTTQIVLDQLVPAWGSSPKISVVLPSGSVETRNISSGSGSTVQVSSAFSVAPNPNSVWLIEWSGLNSQLFRVLTVTETDGILFDCLCLAYNQNKFAEIELGLTLEPRVISVITDPPPTPTGLVLSETLYRYQSEVRLKVIADWVSEPTASSFLVRWRKDLGNWSESTAFSNNFEILDQTQGIFEVEVFARTVFNRISREPATASITALGKTAKPQNVFNLRVD